MGYRTVHMKRERERVREVGEIVLTDMCSVGVVQEQTRGPWDLENLE